MAKRNNNFRNKKFQSSKPYDVSNSFVKKVASRVSELLPQSLWPTKWFSSSNNEIHSPNKGREALNSPQEDNEDDTSPIPAKRARIPLNSSFNEPFFTSSNTGPDYETHRLRHTISSVNTIDDGLDEPIAGPSGIQHQFQPMGSSEPSVPKPRDSLSYSAKKIDVNGEDHSDSSESTSGCSSLPQGDNAEVRNLSRPVSKEPQVETQEQPSIRASAKRKFSETANSSSSAVQSPRSFLGLGGYSPPNRTMPVPVGRRRKPSFNPDAFGFQSWSGEKTNIKDRIVNSPFYSGRTTYGGVAAYQSSLNKSATQPAHEGRRSIQIRPKNLTQMRESATNISSTARRIMEALEMFSSPLQDAKKIPLNDSIHMKRMKVMASPDMSQASLHSSKSSNQALQNSSMRHAGGQAPPVKELVVPTVPDILVMQRRQRLQGSTVAARQAVCETSMQLSSAEKSERSDHVTFSYVGHTNSGRVGGKIKSKEEIDDEPVLEPNLPSIALPITSLPKFDFVFPPVCPPPQPSKQIDSQVSSKPASSMSFKFSSPIAFSGASEMPVSSNNFTFSSPLKALSKNVIETSSSSKNVGSSCESVKSVTGSEKAKPFLSSERENVSKDSIPLMKGAWTSGSSKPEVSSGNGDNSKNVNQGNLQFSVGNKLSESSFGDKFKPAQGTWECETCMVRNNANVSKCVACETQRSSKDSVAGSTKTNATITSGFGNSFKPPSGSWTCDTCLVNNPSSAVKCLACETPRVQDKVASSSCEVSKVVSKVVESGFGDKFKKPDGDWDCSICLVRNKAGGPLKCVACEAPKPGAEPIKEMSSAPKFSFGSPVATGFKFGIDKADLPKKDDPPEKSKPSFAFGNPSTAVASGFTFGVGNASDGATKEKVGGFVFGSTSSDSTDGIKTSSVPQSAPSFSFGVKEDTEKKPTNESNCLKTVSESSPRKTVAKVVSGPDKKSISISGSPAASGFGTSILPKPTTASETKPTFSFTSSEEGKKDSTSSGHTFSFGNNAAVAKPADGEKKPTAVPFSSPSSSNSQSIFGASVVGSGWNASTSFKLDSSPKQSIFAKSAPGLGSPSTNSSKVEGASATPETSTFSFIDSPKTEGSTKLPEVPSTLSTNFKFQESSKTSTFKFEEKSKTASSSLPTLPTSSFASNPFTSGGFGAASKEKAPVSSTTPVSTVASSTSAVGSDSSPAKATNAGLFVFGKGASSAAVSSTSISAESKSSSSSGLFMFGSGTSSQPTAFNLAEQKQPPTTTAVNTSGTEQPAQALTSGIGSTSNIFGSVIPKTSVFGAPSSTPTPSSAASLLTATKSEALTSATSTFASPSSSTMFGSSVSSSVTPAATPSTTTTVSSTSTTFGSSVFGTASTSFSTVGSSAPTPAFGSTPSAPLAASSGFGAPQTSSVFGIGSTTSSTAPFSFSATPKLATEDQPRPPAANAPFVFGSGATASTPAAQPFTFNAAPSKPAFSFGSSSQSTVGASAPSSAAPAAPVLGGFSFGDTSKGSTPFGSAQPPTSIAGGTVNPFGSPPAPQPVANITPAAPTFGAPIGESNAAAGGSFGAAPAFNFGSSQPNAAVFSFNSGQNNAAQNSGFNFGQAPSQQTSAPAVTFNPNMPPSFNFTGGATPQFTATPGVLNSVPAANPLPRRIKKAVRRTQQTR
ncbi:nuclear pore complex protein Nup153 [Ischnura elegans]|uniref:nuclear pore complex protein Nup153 n=1 Tax=Ischnura elegans TaxID=197161 RepID=UPI001ED8B7F9|nr:nuclear pore complex protein Nup153 [Ischnura elegans]